MKCTNPRCAMNLLTAHMRSTKHPQWIKLANAFDEIGHTDSDAIDEIQGFAMSCYAKMNGIDVKKLVESGAVQTSATQVSVKL